MSHIIKRNCGENHRRLPSAWGPAAGASGAGPGGGTRRGSGVHRWGCPPAGSPSVRPEPPIAVPRAPSLVSHAKPRPTPSTPLRATPLAPLQAPLAPLAPPLAPCPLLCPTPRPVPRPASCADPLPVPRSVCPEPCHVRPSVPCAPRPAPHPMPRAPPWSQSSTSGEVASWEGGWLLSPPARGRHVPHTTDSAQQPRPAPSDFLGVEATGDADPTAP